MTQGDQICAERFVDARAMHTEQRGFAWRQRFAGQRDLG